jgi:hypothetical protein
MPQRLNAVLKEILHGELLLLLSLSGPSNPMTLLSTKTFDTIYILHADKHKQSHSLFLRYVCFGVFAVPPRHLTRCRPCMYLPLSRCVWGGGGGLACLRVCACDYLSDFMKQRLTRTSLSRARARSLSLPLLQKVAKAKTPDCKGSSAAACASQGEN